MYESVFLRPFLYLKPSVRAEAVVILCLLFLQMVMLFVTESYRSLFVILASVIGVAAADFLSAGAGRKNVFAWMMSAVQGILIGMFLPSSFPPAAACAVSFSTLFIDRVILGGFAKSWINPVAVTVAVCWIVGIRFFPDSGLSLSDGQAQNAALSLIQNGTFPTQRFDVRITSFLNRRIFSLFGVSIPDGYVSLFWDSRSVIPAFRFNILTLFSSVVLIAFGVLEPLVPGLFVLVYGILVKCLASFFFDGSFFQGDVILAMLSGGTLFCAFFLLQWHGTVPFTNRGKFLYGISAGVLAFFIAGAGLSPIGLVFTVLTANIVSLVIQTWENHISQKFAGSVLAERVRSVQEGTNA